MGLWIGLSERMQSAKCNLLKTISQVDQLPGTLTKTLDNTVPNLSAQLINEESKNQSNTLPTASLKQGILTKTLGTAIPNLTGKSTTEESKNAPSLKSLYKVPTPTLGFG